MKSFVFSNRDCTSSGNDVMPLSKEADFNRCLAKFLATEKGQDYQRAKTIIYDVANERIKFMRISASTIGGWRASRMEKLPIRDKWEELLADF